MFDFSPPAERVPPYERQPRTADRLCKMYAEEIRRAALMSATYRRAVQVVYECTAGVRLLAGESELLECVFGVLHGQADGLRDYVDELVHEANLLGMALGGPWERMVETWGGIVGRDVYEVAGRISRGEGPK